MFKIQMSAPIQAATKHNTGQFRRTNPLIPYFGLVHDWTFIVELETMPRCDWQNRLMSGITGLRPETNHGCRSGAGGMQDQINEMATATAISTRNLMCQFKTRAGAATSCCRRHVKMALQTYQMQRVSHRFESAEE